MSAKGRSDGAASGEHDFYPTPAWCVHELLRRCHDLPTGVWCEPAAGDGAIVRAVEAHRPGQQMWAMLDVREETVEQRFGACPEACLIANEQGDFMRSRPLFNGANLYITNPPFTLAEEFARECMARAGLASGHSAAVALLLRVGFLGSKARVPFWPANAADIYVLCPRPSFSPDGRTDASEYAWFVWTPESRERGYSRILHPTAAAPDAPGRKAR